MGESKDVLMYPTVFGGIIVLLAMDTRDTFVTSETVTLRGSTSLSISKVLLAQSYLQLAAIKKSKQAFSFYRRYKNLV